MSTTRERFMDFRNELARLDDGIKVAMEELEAERVARSHLEQQDSREIDTLSTSLTGKDVEIRDLKRGLRFYRFLFWTLASVVLGASAAFLLISKGLI